MPPSTPRAADALLRRVLPADDAEVVAGDLEETFHTTIVPAAGLRAARRWYWRQVLSVVAARAAAALRPAASDPDMTVPKGRVMAAFRQDFAYAIRSLRKARAFTSVAVAMLAVGIGATVAMFSLAFAVLVKPLPFSDPDRLMLVHLLAPDREAPGTYGEMIWSYPKYRVFREHQRAFEATSTFGHGSWNVTGSGSPERVDGEVVDAAYFPLLGLSPEIGRVFSADETRAAGSPPLAVLGHRLWVSRFGGDRSLPGRTIGLNGVPHTIVGVMPPGFRGLTGQSDLWVPVTSLSAGELEERWNHSYYVVARRHAQVSAAQAQEAVRTLGAVVDREIRPPSGRGGSWSATAVPLDDERVGAVVRRSILLLLAAVCAVLLIVCINLGNLTLVRGLGRQREIAIRAALGASRLRILRQLLTESALLAAAGAAAGLAVAYVAVRAGAALIPDLRMVLPRDETAGLTRIGLAMLGLDGATLVFTVSVAIAATVLFGLGPAWRASRRDLTSTIRSDAADAAGGSGRSVVRSVLIVGEITLALVVLTAAGLMLKSVAFLQAAEIGFRPEELLAARLELPRPRYTQPRATQLLEALVSRLDGQQGVDAVAYGSCVPVSAGCNRTSATFPDRPAAPPGTNPTVGVIWTSPSYFDTLGIRLLRGRTFTAQDRSGQPRVVLINETAARAFWRNEDPIGRRIGLGQGGFEGGAEVIGVVADVRYGPIEAAVMPDVYLPLLQSGRSWGFIFVRSPAPPDSVVPLLRREVHALDPDQPLTDIKLMQARFGEATWRQRTSAWLLAIFAMLALLLAALGIYGVMSQGVTQRTREIGVRLALGAGRSDILRLIIGRVIGLAIAGIVAGIVIAVPAMRLLTALLYQVRPGDPWVFTAFALVLLAVALLAGYVPARRATRVDPLTTLRMD